MEKKQVQSLKNHDTTSDLVASFLSSLVLQPISRDFSKELQQDKMVQLTYNNGSVIVNDDIYVDLMARFITNKIILMIVVVTLM